MKRNGFTLIELIGVIVLVSITVLIVSTSISKALVSGKEKADAQTLDNIVLAARAWAVDNKSELPDEGEDYCVTLSILIDAGYIEKVVMPSTKEEISQNACVTITNEDGLYYYEFNEDSL